MEVVRENGRRARKERRADQFDAKVAGVAEWLRDASYI